MDTDDDIPEDKLLETPEQALPGDLSRLWAIRSGLLYQHQADELNRELAGDAPPRMLMPWTDPREIRRIEEKRYREQRENEQAMREISERQNRLLQRIEEEQARIDDRRREIDDNALRLHDGRRVYVDGERYRDGEGRVLFGAEEAEAARQHEYRPDASTWSQKQEIERRAEDAKQLKEKILQDRESGQERPEDASMRLSGYEQEYHDKIEARAQQAPADYGSADYMAEYALSAVPAFNAAANPASRETIRKLTDDDSGAQTAEIKQELVPVAGEGENKKPRQPFGQGAQKFQV
jgi:hypothetical protein